MKLDGMGWPVIEQPEPMEPDELEKILKLLGEVYGHATKKLPARVLADALCMTSDRQISRWRRGQGAIPPHHVKTIRLFREHGRLY